MKILDNKYDKVEIYKDITIPDDFVVIKNKIGNGSGGAKLYLGSDNSQLRNFFGTNGFINKCFFIKKDLIDYMKMAETEYKNPTQNYKYKSELSGLYFKRLNKVLNLPKKISFNVQEPQLTRSDVYINSLGDKTNYNIMREICLPSISHLKITKIQNDDDIFFYYKLNISLRISK
tara:strand:+ start:259 stop:783 length:525 start_codon:yes stop_codon:yes gene_type:complete